MRPTFNFILLNWHVTLTCEMQQTRGRMGPNKTAEVRGSRFSHISDLIQAATGSQRALISPGAMRVCLSWLKTATFLDHLKWLHDTLAHPKHSSSQYGGSPGLVPAGLRSRRLRVYSRETKGPAGCNLGAEQWYEKPLEQNWLISQAIKLQVKLCQSSTNR